MTIQAAAAITTSAVAVLVAIITSREWMTNRARLRHELFDRRYAAYNRITVFLAEILQTGKVPVGGDVRFLRESKKAIFVFGCDPTVKKLLEGIYQDVIRLQALNADLERLVGEERTVGSDRWLDIERRLQAKLSSMEARFEKFLRLKS